MHIECLVEEPSAEAALHYLIPQIVPDAGFSIHPFQGKHDLLRKLPARLRGYRSWLPEDGRIVVLIDADQNDCKQQKAQLEQYASTAGFVTSTTCAAGATFQVLNRLAMHELEAWLLGDRDALQKAYPKVAKDLEKKKGYRNPDSIRDTWEALERVLQQAGYHKSGLRKIEAARAIAQHMRPGANRSPSFRVFCQGLQALTAPREE